MEDWAKCKLQSHLIRKVFQDLALTLKSDRPLYFSSLNVLEIGVRFLPQKEWPNAIQPGSVSP